MARKKSSSQGRLEFGSGEASSGVADSAACATENGPEPGPAIPAEAPAAAPAASPAKTGGARRTVYVLDAHAILYQVFHGMGPMTSPSGQPVGAIYGFCRDVLDLFDKRKPDYLFCAFDSSGPGFRHSLFADYKVHREEMPSDLKFQVGRLKETLEALAIPILESPGFEADDVMATAARRAIEDGLDCYLVTNDKDCRQLLNDHVALYYIRKQEMYGPEQLLVDWGIRPEQVVDFQTLVGDPVDNVPGVPLIGPKTATGLLQELGTLENLLKNIDKVPGKKKQENLRDAQPTLQISRDLVRLRDDVPIEIDWERGCAGGGDPAAVDAIVREFGFRGLGQRMMVLANRGCDNPLPIDLPAGFEVSGGAPSSDESRRLSKVGDADWKADYRLIDDEEKFRSFLAELSNVEEFAFDTETTSTHPRQAIVVGLSFCWKEGEAYYLPLMGPPESKLLDRETTIAGLKPILEDPNKRKLTHHGKYDVQVLRTAGIVVHGIVFDSLVADYLLQPGARAHGMDEQAKYYLRHENISITSLIGTGKKQIRMDEAEVADVAVYAAEDADVTFRLANLLRKEIDDAGLALLFDEIEMPVSETLAEMEYRGIAVDAERLRLLGEDLGKQIEALRERLFEMAGELFNPDSPKQLGELLFNKLKMPVIKRTKTGPSTDAEVLEELADRLGEGSLPAALMEYRQLTKLKGTYIDAFLDPTCQIIHPKTKRIHTSFMQDVAATGRLSSKDPNLQNIPIRSENGRAIRSSFIPGESGWKLFSADYSQIELRVLAHFSGDEALRDAFAREEDIHTRVAAQVFEVAPEEVDREMRRRAKAVNFGIIYGQSPFGLSKGLGISREEAASFIDAYFRGYPGVQQFILQTLRDTRRLGYVSTLSGRRRPVDGVRDPDTVKDPYQRTVPERIAVNTVIQGTAADLIKVAMVRLEQGIAAAKLRARLLLQVHDELVLEAPEEEVDAVAAIVRETMTGADRHPCLQPLAVPLSIDAKVGDNWRDGVTYDFPK
ncbi:MAG TPA: DNA polymerase I [Pirellulaceae bacterium]|nr:DNA polymerase I [Pirellulaceae bacterium]